VQSKPITESCLAALIVSAGYNLNARLLLFGAVADVEFGSWDKKNGF
jgi:hypothetical protein